MFSTGRPASLHLLSFGCLTSCSTWQIMSQTPLYPLRFAPIYQYRLWGGRRLANLLTAPKPGDAVFLPAGAWWCLRVQQNSDVTFRLYACIDFMEGPASFALSRSLSNLRQV
jgi:hypothetical protein